MYIILKKLMCAVAAFTVGACATTGNCLQSTNSSQNCVNMPQTACTSGQCSSADNTSSCADCGNDITVSIQSKPSQTSQEDITSSDCCAQNSDESSETTATTDNADILAEEYEVVRIVNEIRESYGLNALEIDINLCNIARQKSTDMYENKYFSHNSPTYGSAFDMLKANNVPYRTAGENIAMGYKTAGKVVTGWMNSNGHRANILNRNYKKIGVGYCANGNYWTQIFVG